MSGLLVHNEIYNREGLKRNDPLLFALVDRDFKANRWRYEGSCNTTNKVVTVKQ